MANAKRERRGRIRHPDGDRYKESAYRTLGRTEFQRWERSRGR